MLSFTAADVAAFVPVFEKFKDSKAECSVGNGNAQEASGLFEEIYQAGNYGVKSGAGFYDYSDGKADVAIKNRDAMYLAMAKAKITDITAE